MLTELILTLKDRRKTIPYIPETRTDGTVNYGFRMLKNQAENLDAIPEARDNQALRHALAVINDKSTAFFTVGCEKDINESPEGHWVRGYLEFSFIDPGVAAVAGEYFDVFLHFNRHITASCIDLPVQYHFEFEEAYFKDTGSPGYTAAVWITTLGFPAADDAWHPWNRAIMVLADFLSSYQRGAMS